MLGCGCLEAPTSEAGRRMMFIAREITLTSGQRLNTSEWIDVMVRRSQSPSFHSKRGHFAIVRTCPAWYKARRGRRDSLSV